MSNVANKSIDPVFLSSLRAGARVDLPHSLPPDGAGATTYSCLKIGSDLSPKWRIATAGQAITCARMPLEGHCKRVNTPLRKLTSRERNVVIAGLAVTAVAILALLFLAGHNDGRCSTKTAATGPDASKSRSPAASAANR